MGLDERRRLLRCSIRLPKELAWFARLAALSVGITFMLSPWHVCATTCIGTGSQIYELTLGERKVNDILDLNASPPSGTWADLRTNEGSTDSVNDLVFSIERHDGQVEGFIAIGFEYSGPVS